MSRADFDKQQWQAEQAERDALEEKQRAKFEKARARSARNARRKLERLHKKLEASGELTDWEAEFAESVTERLDQYGSAFQDLTKGRPGDALSFAQKRVVSSLKRKSKSKKTGTGDDDTPRSSFSKKKSGFKNKTGFTPRVRQIEDDFEGEIDGCTIDNEAGKAEPFLPEYDTGESRPAAKPFLRVVK